jgi:iron complex outermembrane receptor protein
MGGRLRLRKGTIHMKGFRVAGLHVASLLLAAEPLLAQAPPTPTTSAEVVVSATKLPEESVDTAGSTTVVTGEELRRQNVRTVAEAIQNVTGIDTGNGSDNGPHGANIGMWGVKEFDALLVTVDGVPVGGPFNPALAQIPVDDIDRIEIVKGPQGTLYGVSAFAGMVQVFTRSSETPHGSVRAGGGSFSEWNADLNWGMSPTKGLNLRLYGSLARDAGWQDRTSFSDSRLTISGDSTWGDTTVRLGVTTALWYNYFGSPMPYEAGQQIPGFVVADNYAVVGARIDHRFTTVFGGLSTPLGSGWTLEDTFGLTHDDQIQTRSFMTATDGITASATGTSLTPVESTAFNDLRATGRFQAAGSHRLVGGIGLTWGRTTATGIGFDFDLVVSPVPIVPSLDQIPVGDNRSFEDRRTFWGFYVNDQWTPVSWLTVTAGARYDLTSEALQAAQQEVGTPSPDVSTDSQSNGAWSGGVSALIRLLSKPAGPLETANVYGGWRTNFKPAAPNLTEAEAATILQPERTYAWEAGLKTRWLAQQVSVDVSFFDMTFKNMVVPILGPNGEAILTNAGEESFKGVEIDGSWQPPAIPGLSVGGGYAHHNAKYVQFGFETPEGELVVVDGKRIEMVPRDLWSIRLGYGTGEGPGAFVNMRHQNERPLNRRNTYYTPSFFEVDAGISWEFPHVRVGVMGRNLSNARPPVTESEIGDSQYYIASPRRFLGEVTVKF